jgi:hypothetical protein
MMNTQSSAPMEASTPTPNPAPASAIASAGSQSQTQEQPAQPMPIVPLNAPTQRPTEPVTSGATLGPGPDQTSLGLPSPEVSSYQNGKSYIQTLAHSPDASPALKALAQSFNGAF